MHKRRLSHVIASVLCVFFLIITACVSRPGKAEPVKPAIATTETVKPFTLMPAPAPEGKLIVGYFIEWGIYARGYKGRDIPVDKLTHINYAFAGISDDFEIQKLDPWADVEINLPGQDSSLSFRGNFNQLVVLKRAHPNLKTLISIGGWTKSKNFSTLTKSAENRLKFAVSCVDFIRNYRFDGVDIDWEYPGGGGMEGTDFDPVNDKTNFTLLLKDLRTELDKAGAGDGKSYLLTAATGSGMEKIANLELDKIAPFVNYIDVMCYDFHGGWDAVSNHQSALYAGPDDPTPDSAPTFLKTKANVDAVIKEYTDGGFPKNKIVLGVPFYGRAWAVSSTENNGLYQPSVPGKTPIGTWEAGVYDYSDLKSRFFPSAAILWDDKAGASSMLVQDKSSDKNDTAVYDTFVSFDGVQSVGAKCDYVNSNGLAGMMFWELTGDRTNELVDVIYSKMFTK